MLLTADTGCDLQVAQILGRLLYSPRARPQETAQRLALVERMLRSGSGWWTAEELAETPDQIELMRVRLKELRKMGVISWDEQVGAYAFDPRLRVPLALTLLSCADQGPDANQLQLLDSLIPFARLASRGDLRAAPAWAMVDLLQRDVRQMEQALAGGPQALAQLAREKWLIRSAQDMEETVGRLRQLEEEQMPELADLVQRAIELLSLAGEHLTRLSVRMSRTSRDQMRLRGSRFSAAQLREIADRLDCEQAAAAISDSAGLAVRITLLPSEEELAALAPREQLSEQMEVKADRHLPDPAQMIQTSLPLVEEPPAPDAKQVAQERIAEVSKAAPRQMARHLFAEVPEWGEAIRIHHGLIRLQSESARRGRALWRALPEQVQLDGGPVKQLSEIEMVAVGE